MANSNKRKNRKNKKESRIEPTIHNAWFGRTVVTRSQQRVLDANGIRECHVRIATNFPTITMAWLSRERPPQSSLPRAAVLVSSASTSTADDIVRPVPTQRRASVASCRNMFDVGGGIVEVGFDRLEKIDCRQKSGSNEEASAAIVATATGAASSNEENKPDDNHVNSTTLNNVEGAGFAGGAESVVEEDGVDETWDPEFFMYDEDSDDSGGSDDFFECDQKDDSLENADAADTSMHSIGLTGPGDDINTIQLDQSVPPSTSVSEHGIDPNQCDRKDDGLENADAPDTSMHSTGLTGPGDDINTVQLDQSVPPSTSALECGSDVNLLSRVQKDHKENTTIGDLENVSASMRPVDSVDLHDDITAVQLVQQILPSTSASSIHGSDANSANVVQNLHNNVPSDGRFGSLGRSTQFDPFKRGQNIPFGMYERRPSICVMSSIPSP